MTKFIVCGSKFSTLKDAISAINFKITDVKMHELFVNALNESGRCHTFVTPADMPCEINVDIPLGDILKFSDNTSMMALYKKLFEQWCILQEQNAKYDFAIWFAGERLESWIDYMGYTIELA